MAKQVRAGTELGSRVLSIHSKLSPTGRESCIEQNHPVTKTLREPVNILLENLQEFSRGTVAAVWVRPLAQELLHAVGLVGEKKKKSCKSFHAMPSERFITRGRKG